MHLTRSGIFISLILLSSTVLALCQEAASARAISEAKEFIQQGYNHSSSDRYEQAKNILRPFESIGDHQELVEYYLGYIDYEMAVDVTGMDKEKSPAYLDSAVEHLKLAIEKDDTMAEAHALLAGCYGLQISFSPISGIWRGPKSASQRSKAKELSPENPRVVLLAALSTYNSPALFGGSKEEGLEGFKKAAEFFDRWKSSDSLQPDWGKEQVYAWIGVAYLDKNDKTLARRAFEKALEINPEYERVKNVLMKKVAYDVGSK